MRRAIIQAQKGFTLVELLAVMAILAVLLAVVAPAVTGTRDASIESQAVSDSAQVRSASADFFSRKNEQEVRTPQTVLTTTKITSNASQGTALKLLVPSTDFAVQQAQQIVSDHWAEKYITQQAIAVAATGTQTAVAVATGTQTDIGARYDKVFETGSTPVVDTVVLLDKSDNSIGGGCFLSRMNAINLNALQDAGLLATAPSGDDLLSGGFPNFLWLYHKVTSSTRNVDDSRDPVVMKLEKLEKLEGQTGRGSAQKVKLTYKLVIGDVRECARVSIVTPSPLASDTVSGTAPAYVGATIKAEGGRTRYTWAINDVTVGSTAVIMAGLPTGVTAVQTAGSNDLTLAGTPSASGNFTFTVKVTDQSIPPQTATKRFSITIGGTQ